MVILISGFLIDYCPFFTVRLQLQLHLNMYTILHVQRVIKRGGAGGARNMQCSNAAAIETATLYSLGSKDLESMFACN